MGGMGTIVAVPTRSSVEVVDNRIVLHGVSWSDYERLLEIRGESAGVRLTYLKGDLELMSPSRIHEGITALIGRLVEAYADAKDLEIESFGSWTLRSQPKERGLEPDECYILGDPDGRETPDLAIEVEWTSSLVDKLEVYRGLGIREVWVWHRGEIEVNVLAGQSYERAERSALLPDLDLAGLTRHLAFPTQAKAVKAYRAWLRRRK
jgi:Uma2 family endonuclease